MLLLENEPIAQLEYLTEKVLKKTPYARQSVSNDHLREIFQPFNSFKTHTT